MGSPIRRSAANLMWVALALLALVGAAALVLFGLLMVEQFRHCTPPEPDSGWMRECDMNAELSVRLAFYGIPMVLPLLVALVVRRSRRKTRV